MRLLERLRIWGGLFIASTVWGSTWLAIKIGLLSMPPIFSVTIPYEISERLAKGDPICRLVLKK